MNKKKVIIDCDPGIDDALALALALSSKELDILAITTVAGNISLDLATDNALKVLKIFNKLEIPVYTGADKPLVKELNTATEFHGKDGLGDTNLEKVMEVTPKTNAAEYIVKTLKENKDVSVVALGPLTNIAKAIQLDRESFNNVTELVCMGGNLHCTGNVTPHAEFNFYVDPESVEIVLNNINKPMHMIGLDVTNKILLTPEQIEKIGEYNNPVSEFFLKILHKYRKSYLEQEEIDGCILNDPLAIAYFMDKSICSGGKYCLNIENNGNQRGKLNILEGKSNMVVLKEVEYNKFMNLFISTIFNN